MPAIVTGFAAMRQEAAARRARRQTAPSKTKPVEAADAPPDESTSVANLQNELDFSKWYNEVEDDLLEASYDEYQYETAFFPMANVRFVDMSCN